jgi:hypothetical protein
MDAAITGGGAEGDDGVLPALTGRAGNLADDEQSAKARGVELVVWNAARRLAILVVCALALVAVPFVRDARIGLLPAASGGLALALLAAAVLPLVRASRLLREAQRPPKAPPAAMVYRASSTEEDRDPEERSATHQAAVALMLLALAAALTVVAAAAR